MNKKIKKIDIQSFRIYNEKQSFNFINEKSGEIADLVTIYAPNGYGKTSFFDAIEWTITDEIERLKSLPIKEEIKNVGKYVLKNRDSKDPFGSVVITDEDNNEIKAETRPIKGRMIGDYRSPKKDIAKELKSIQDERDSFCNTNFMAHHKIVGFLEKYTPSSKTDELRVLWDEDHYYGDTLKEINAISDELEKKQKQLNEEIKKQKKELLAFKYENEFLNEFDVILKNYFVKYNNVVVDKNALDINELQSYFNNLREKTQIEKYKINKEQVENSVLRDDLPKYIKNKCDMSILENETAKCKKEINILENIEKNEILKTKILKEVEKNFGIIGQLDNYYNAINKCNLIKEKIENTEKEKVIQNKKKIDIEARIENINKEVEKSKQCGMSVLSEIQVLNEDFSKYKNCISMNKEYEGKLKTANEKLENIEVEVKKLLNTINLIDMYFDNKIDLKRIIHLFSEKCGKNYYLLDSLKRNKKIYIENITVLEKTKQSIIELSDRLQKIIINGKDFVVHSQEKICPLCHKEYDNYEELLSRIDEVRTDNRLDSIDCQIKQIKLKQGDLDNKIGMLEEEINSEIIMELEKYKELYVTKNKEKSLLEETIKNCEKSKETCKKSYTKLIKDYEIKQVQICSETSVREKELELSKKYDEQSLLLKKYLTQKEKDKIILDDCTKYIKELELLLIDMKEEIRKIQTDKQYITIGTFLENKDYYKPEYNSVQMNKLLKRENEKLEEKVKSIEIDLVKVNLEVAGTKDELELKLKNLQNNIISLQLEIDTFISRCKKTIGEVENDELLGEVIRKKIEALDNRLNFVIDKEQSENRIINLLSNLKQQNAWLEKKRNLEKNELNLEHLSKRYNELQKSKNLVEKFIIERTNELFNQELINQLYIKLDPHPTLKHIKFKTVSDAKEIKTYIYACDKNEDNQISPILYLSSAQVNILSLCIFLARILCEKETTFNTIFMDDPIQHLDGINLLSFIDILRTITSDLGRQIVISTHNEQFYRLLRVKMDNKYYSSKFIELSNGGVIKEINN